MACCELCVFTVVTESTATSRHVMTIACAGIVLRHARQDMQVSKDGRRCTSVKRGTLVALCPYTINHDARFFNNAAEYEPSRHKPTSTASKHSSSSSEAESAEAAKNGRCPVDIAFGAGAYRCPGRAFANCQLRLALAAFMLLFDAQLMQKCASQASAPDVQHCQEDMQKKVPHWLSTRQVPGRHVVARGVTSGDVHGALPAWRPQLLVGVKKPVTSMFVNLQSRVEV